MAGWKLRKDKTQAEMPASDPDASAPAVQSTPAEQSTPASDTSPAAESPDWLTDGWQTPTEIDPIALDEVSRPESEATAAQTVPYPLPDFETDNGPQFDDLQSNDLQSNDLQSDSPNFQEEPPLTLVDYTEPADTEPHAAPVPETPFPETPASASVFAMPRLEPSAYGSAGTAGEDDYSHTLRMNREEMAAAFPASILSGGTASDVPTVAPFVLDAPAAPTDEPTYRLVLQVGRLSAPFDITKSVTIIGRPDSALHYYPDIEVDMDDAVSRRHAEVLRREDGCYLTDVGSTNGTLLNGEKLEPMEERLLVHGDRIRIGERTEIIFE